ncbi:fimbrillin family protein [Segatella copri]|uniref:fimbrillin family protein n=1 Tax=Segatella copri TaxID=165179 RepID=UPI002232246E|nr:leucine-rich repeat protein [Segatella copri]MCW4085356.1 leucine-rich repeat protein [Segatella copri]MCW4160234.1 leucine-rich repeat protein [Segatella copri]
MKITRYMGAFAVIAMLAACSTDDELGANTAANEVKIAATVGGNSIFTRSNPVGTEAEQQSFNENDAISVTTEGKTVVYTKNKTGQWANANDYQLWTGNAQTFEAFYPGNSTNSISEGHIEADQSDITKIAQSDYMTCTENVTKIPDTRQLTLNFERQTARIIVKVSAFGNEFETRIPTLSAVEVYSKLKVPAGESDSYVGIQACKKDNVFYALVSPGTANSTEKFLKLTVTYNDGVGNPTQTKELYVTGIPALEKAESYTYDVRIGKDNAIIGSVSVADWGTGDAITGGDASILTPELIIKQALAAGKTDITLNLAKDFNDFSKIRNAIRNAAPNDEGTIELTIIGVETIPEGAFKRMSQLKSVKMPDVKEIKKYAFSECQYLTVVEAPSLNKLNSGAFNECYLLSKLTFGPINYADARYWQIFSDITPNIDLILSDYQKEMIKTDDNLYTANNDIDYADSNKHWNKNFLGREFKSITCRFKVE